MRYLSVRNSGEYELIIGSGFLKSAYGLITSKITADKFIIITDSIVASHHLELFTSSFPKDKFHILILEPGEQIKSFNNFEEVVEKILSLNISRNTCLIALGGGVVGDLTGFIASTLLRGVRYIQVPTTLLAQVDSSVGGKTAINSSHGKNLIGSFYQPSMVLIDSETLKTLSKSEFINGYAEVVKYGLLGDISFFYWLDSHLDEVMRQDKDVIEKIIYQSCKIKKDFVERDEKEEGDRALLNLGHTFGHAIEMLSGYKIPHGFAVAIGMVKACKMSISMGWMKDRDLEIIMAHLLRAGLPVKSIYSISQMIPYMRKDKKNSSGKFTLILMKALGQAVIVKGVEEADLLAVLE